MQEAGRGGDAFLTLKVSWSSICSTARQSAEYCVPPICTKRDVVQRSCACPIHGDIQGQMGWGPGQPALVSGNMPIATLWVLRSLPTQAVLLFNDSYSSQEKEKSSQTAIGTFKSVFIDMTQLTRICPSGVQESVTTGHISHGNALQVTRSAQLKSALLCSNDFPVLFNCKILLASWALRASSSKPSISAHSLLWAVPCKTHTEHSQLQQSSLSTWANTHPMQQPHVNTAHTQRGTMRGEFWNRWSMKGKERSWFYGYISREKHQRKNPSQQWHLEPKSRWHPQRDSREISLFLWLLRLLLELLPFSEATAVVFRGTNLGSAPVAVI